LRECGSSFAPSGRLAVTAPIKKAMPRSRKTKVQRVQPVLNAHAAGADIGAREIYVAIPHEQDAQPVRRFETFTEELKKLVAWPKSTASPPRRWRRPVCTGSHWPNY
jgi:hypothetical protein